jgi:acyl-CoA synthetase (AMP-forming)/AMP-acid ligase II
VDCAPSPGVEVAICDEEGRELPRGAVGKVRARGENSMLGYGNRPEATAEALCDGWLHTRDGAYMDEEGFVFIMDRLKDMIISGRGNIFSAEVESAIYQHAGVAECAAIGIPHVTWGEQGHAIVRLHDAVDLDEATPIEHCKRFIAGFKCPRSVEFRSAAHPGRCVDSESTSPGSKLRDMPEIGVSHALCSKCRSSMATARLVGSSRKLVSYKMSFAARRINLQRTQPGATSQRNRLSPPTGPAWFVDCKPAGR